MPSIVPVGMVWVGSLKSPSSAIPIALRTAGSMLSTGSIEILGVFIPCLRSGGAAQHLPLYVVLFNLIVESGPVDIQFPGCVGDIPLMFIEYPLDMILFHIFKGAGFLCYVR